MSAPRIHIVPMVSRLGRVVYRFVEPGSCRTVEFYQRGLGPLRFRESMGVPGALDADGRAGSVSAAFHHSHDSAMTAALLEIPWLREVAAREAEASAYVDGLEAVELAPRQTPFDIGCAVADPGSARLVWLTNRERGRVSRLLRGERDALLAACASIPIGYTNLWLLEALRGFHPPTLLPARDSRQVPDVRSSVNVASTLPTECWAGRALVVLREPMPCPSDHHDLVSVHEDLDAAIEDARRHTERARRRTIVARLLIDAYWH